MINVNLFWYLLVPVILAVASYFILPRISNAERKDAAMLSGMGLGLSVLVISLAFYAGIGAKTSDTEIWNGAVLDKAREHGHYLRPYDCNCREVCSGTGQSRSCRRVCDTCYEDRYTVTWSCSTTIGSYTIEHYDTTSKSVYKSPDPQRWTIIKKDDPVSKAVSYTNYVKAVPQSLFRPAAADLKAKFASALPPYPINVYDFYKVDRVLAVGVAVPNLREWNDKLSDALKFIGPQKQVNAVIVFVNSADPNYEYALQDAWTGAKKNDVVLIIGTTSYPKIEWVRVLSWTDRQLFKVKLRDELQDFGTINVDSVISTLKSNIVANFERKRMRDFQYLKGEIDPPVWVIVTALSLVILLFVGSWAYIWYDFRKALRRSQPGRRYSQWNGI
jgi:hypothetical protein